MLFFREDSSLQRALLQAMQPFCMASSQARNPTTLAADDQRAVTRLLSGNELRYDSAQAVLWLFAPGLRIEAAC